MKENDLHPLFIQIREKGHTKNQSTPLKGTRQSSWTDKAERDTIGAGTFIEEFTEGMLEKRRGMAGFLLVHHAGQARWLNAYWRRYFLMSTQDIDNKEKPIIHIIEQVPIISGHEQEKLTPLIVDSPRIDVNWTTSRHGRLEARLHDRFQ